VASIRAAGLRLELPYWREVALGGALGTAARLGVDTVVGAPFGSWDAGVFVANVTGALLLGFLAGLPLDTPGHARWRAFAGTGFLGAYTTFSTFVVETDQLLDHGRLRVALTYVVASLVAGLAAAAIGMAGGRLLARPAVAS